MAEPDSGDLEEMQLLLLTMDEMLQALLSGGVDVLGAAAAIGLAAARLNS